MVREIVWKSGMGDYMFMNSYYCKLCDRYTEHLCYHYYNIQTQTYKCTEHSFVNK